MLSFHLEVRLESVVVVNTSLQTAALPVQMARSKIMNSACMACVSMADIDDRRALTKTVPAFVSALGHQLTYLQLSS